ncbi:MULTISPECIES: antibiotic biosynthesis monooxygenase family protein [Sporolactobacillus]|uniref:Heme-degrading monooxygenase HmoA n=1 Tax=Sporolactobacillus nakayamae TaxID=269670 RepID=A0A1I2TPP1_9BACL|nr:MULTISPECIES: antibiotic biosynthesis monooxygenase [Sporolactobacillus]MCQ2010207.1 antibiotic biosynthesis monooxygenase [Sporolactobacillus sp. STSJ-5]SFG66119.1 Heme-degrading monooxygenase HmoA [Sporolactobacillus nakayamae]
MSFAKTPTPPYYAVIFTSKRTEVEEKEYGIVADRMVALAREQPGFLGVESAREEQGIGITVSYWSSLDATKQWKKNAEHQMAQEKGKRDWYESFVTRISKVERDYTFKC